jgi:hypothetical protein
VREAREDRRQQDAADERRRAHDECRSHCDSGWAQCGSNYTCDDACHATCNAQREFCWAGCS